MASGAHVSKKKKERKKVLGNCLLTYLLLKTTDLEITVHLQCNKTRMRCLEIVHCSLALFHNVLFRKQLKNSIDHMTTEREI